MAESPFSEFEEEFKNTEAAKAGSSVGRLPEGVYKGVCTTVDLEGDGKMVDKNVFGGGDKTKGLKIFLEILEPEKVGEITTKGEIHEYVFWVTAKSLPYVKRDASTILGKPVNSLAELAACEWAGHTVEFGLKDETYNGFTRSKVTFFNAWDPKTAKPDPKGATKKDPAKTATTKKAAAPPKEEEPAF
jgi:hypothetical protein